MRLPFDVPTGRLDDEVWQRWLARDPVRMAPDHAEALATQRAIWIDAGSSDDFYLDLGATAFHQQLLDLGVDDHHFELFAGTHAGIDHRHPAALQYLAQRLSPA